MKLMKRSLNSSNPEMGKANYRPLVLGFCVLALPLNVLNAVNEKCSGLQDSRLPANCFYLVDFLMDQHPSLLLSPFQCDRTDHKIWMHWATVQAGETPRTSQAPS